MKTFTNVTLEDLLAQSTWPHSMNPTLCDKIGIYETAVVEYLHRWIFYKKKHQEKFKDSLRKGKFWVWKTLKEWSEDFPYIPYRTLRRVLDSLKANNIIEVAEFNRFRANRTRWYTLNYLKTFKIFKSICPQWTNGVATVDKCHLSTEDKSRHCSTISNTSSKDESLRSSFPTGEQGDHPRVPSKQESKSSSAGTPPPREPLKKTYAKKKLSKLKASLQKRVKITDAVELWKALLSWYDVTSHISLTKKEVGMMKSLVSWLSEIEVPIEEFLEFAVSNWTQIRDSLRWPDSNRYRLGEYPFFQEIIFNKEDILRLWEKSKNEDLKTFAPEEEKWIVISSEDQIPEDLPNREKIASQIRVFGTAKIPKKGGE